MKQTNVSFPIGKNDYSNSNSWSSLSSDWVLADTCPECHNLGCSQLLDNNGDILRYMCPECSHEWTPPSTIKFEYSGSTLEVSEVDPEVIRQTQKNVEHKLFEQYLYSLL